MSNQEQKSTSESKKDYVLEVQGLKVDYAYRDEMAMRRLKEEPAMQTYLEDIQAKTGKVNASLEQLRQAVMKGRHQSSSVDDKLAMQELMEAADFQVHHRFAQPEDPSRVKLQQANLEDAVSSFQRQHVAPTERMVKTFNGELSGEALSPGKLYEAFKASSGEISSLQKAAEISANLPPEQLKQLQTEIADALKRLNEMEPEVKKVAEEKAFKPGEKNEKLKQYEIMFAAYEKQRTELQELIDRIKKKSS